MIKIVNATKFPSGGYSALLNLDSEVREVAVVETADGEYIGLFPQKAIVKKVFGADGKPETDENGNEKTKVAYSTVITGSREELNRLVTELVERGEVKMLNSPIETSLGKKIGYARVTMNVNLSVNVNVKEDGTAYMLLPGRPYTVKTEDGKEEKKTEFFVYIDRDERDDLAKQIVEEAVDYVPPKKD